MVFAGTAFPPADSCASRLYRRTYRALHWCRHRPVAEEVQDFGDLGSAQKAGSTPSAFAPSRRQCAVCLPHGDVDRPPAPGAVAITLSLVGGVLAADDIRSQSSGTHTGGVWVAVNTEQDNWRFCNKCYVLWWNGHQDNGRCPAGGAHEGSGSWDFYLPADSDIGPDRPPGSVLID